MSSGNPTRKLLWPTIFMALAMVAALIQICAFWTIVKTSHYHFSTWFYTSLSDLFLLFLPYFFLPKGWRWTTLLLTAGITALLLSNFWYMQAYVDLMPLKSYFMFGNVGRFVVEGTIDAMRWTDLWVWLPAVCVFAAYFLLRRRIETANYSSRARWIWAIACLTLFVGGQGIRAVKYEKKVRAGIHYPYHKAWKTQHAKYACADIYGFPIFLFNELRMWLTPNEKLSDAEVADIWRLISENRIEANDSLSISLAERNRDKNLIVVIVESLNSDAIGKEIDGNKVTPNLDALIQSDSVLYFNKIVPQVSHARSADGQLLINTGFLPLVNEATAFEFGSNEYPSLAKAKNCASFEVVCESMTLWNHEATNKAYGFDSYIDKIEYCPEVKDSWWKIDSLMFDRGVEAMSLSEQPFYCELTTMSMHDPYLKLPDRAEWFENLTDYDHRDVNYLAEVNRFDGALGKFLDDLKEKGLYENSVIVVVSDHDARPTALSGELLSNNVALLVINGGVDLRSDQVIGQVDIFPTLLHVMGLTDYFWHGLGKSVLTSGSPTSAIDKYGVVHGEAPDSVVARQRKMWEVSEKLIRSDFFRNYKDKIPSGVR